MAGLGDLIVVVGADISRFTAAFKTIVQTVSDSVDAVQDKMASFDDLGMSLVKAGTALTVGLTAPLVGLGKASLETAAQFEQTKIAFTSILHSAGAAEQMLKGLYDFAAHTPFQIQGILQGARTLTAMGFAAKQIIPMMRTLGDTVSALGTGQEGLERLIYHMGQIQSLGHIDGRIIREMGQQGIAAGQILADGLGKSVEEVMEMVSKKSIDAKTAIDLLVAGMNKRFGGGMEAQMASFSGMLSNLKDNITYTKDAIGEQLLPAGKMIVDLLGSLSGAARELATAFGNLPEPVKISAIAIAAVGAAAGPLLTLSGGLLLSIGALAQVWPVLTLGVSVTTVALRGAAVAVSQVAASLTSLVVPMGAVSVTSRAAAVSLSVLSTAAAAVIAVFAGWKLGTWASENIGWVHEVGAAFDELMSKIGLFNRLMDKFGGVSKAASEGAKQLQDSVNRLQAALAAHGVTIKQGSMSLEEYAHKLAAVAASTKVTVDAASAMADLAKKHKEAAAELKTATSYLATVNKAYKEGLANINDLRAATDRWKAAMAAANPQLHATGVALRDLAKVPEIKFGVRKLDLDDLEFRANAIKDAKLMDQLAASFLRFKVDMESGDIGDDAMQIASKLEEMARAGTASIKNLDDAIKSITTSGDPLKAVNDAFKTLGVQSSASLKDTADKAIAAYNLIKNSGVASADDIKKAYDAMNDAIAKAGGGGKGGGAGDWITKMTDQFGTSIQKMLDGQEKFSRGFRQMGVGLLQSWGQQVDKMAAQWAAMALKNLLVHVLTSAGILATSSATAAGTTAVWSLAHMKQTLMDAKGAATRAFNSAMALPFPINAVVAPAAAAVAFSAVLALGAVSAEHGAVLPNHNTIGLLHPNEMVLPSAISKGLQGMIANGGGQGRAIQVHQNNTYRGAPSMSKSQMEGFHKQSIKQATRMIRNNALGH